MDGKMGKTNNNMLNLGQEVEDTTLGAVIDFEVLSTIEVPELQKVIGDSRESIIDKIHRSYGTRKS